MLYRDYTGIREKNKRSKQMCWEPTPCKGVGLGIWNRQLDALLCTVIVCFVVQVETAFRV